MVRSALTVQEKAEIWRRYRAGDSLRSISRALGRSMEALRMLVASTGGRLPRVVRQSKRRLSLAERERSRAGSSQVIRAGRSPGVSNVPRRPCHVRSPATVAASAIVRTRRSRQRGDVPAVLNLRSS